MVQKLPSRVVIPRISNVFEDKNSTVLKNYFKIAFGNRWRHRVFSIINYAGLAAGKAERRTKEIGIRKVLGASVAGLTRLLAKEFLQLVTISSIIAFPLAWWFMSNWLQDYSYRSSKTINDGL